MAGVSIHIPGGAVSAVAGAIEHEASAALRSVQQAWSAAPKRAPARIASAAKDWSIPVLIGGAGLTYLSSPSGDSSISSSLFGPAAQTSPPSSAPVTARPPAGAVPAPDSDLARVGAMLTDVSSRRFSGVQVDTSDPTSEPLPLPLSLQKSSIYRQIRQQSSFATKPVNYFDRYDKETEFWSGKAEDLPATFDERFGGAANQ